MWDRVHASMRHWARLIGRGSPGAHVVERDGIVAAIVPVAPERSVPNSVVYHNPESLAAAYDELAAAYREVGANWTVWVHPGDDPAAAVLERAGHVLDAEPEAMAADLTGGVERPPADALDDWTPDGDTADVGPLNDRAYGLATDSYTRAFSELSGDDLRVYVARRAGGLPDGQRPRAQHQGGDGGGGPRGARRGPGGQAARARARRRRGTRHRDEHIGGQCARPPGL